MTFVSYPDITATSDNGRFRIEIKGTKTDDAFRDQSHFVYRLYNFDCLEWEWTANQSEDDHLIYLDDFPHDAWVNDHGWVVVRTHEWFHAGLLVLSPAGKVVLRRFHRALLEDDGPGFLQGEPEWYLGGSSAGPFWARCSIAYFHEHGGHPFWTIRTWWGRRVVIDLVRGEFTDPDAMDDDLHHRHECEQVFKLLDSSVNVLEESHRMDSPEETDDAWWSLAGSAITAAYHAGWLETKDCIPHLRRLELLDAEGSRWFGGVDWATLITLPFRRVAKVSLLRMNQIPKWLSHYKFEADLETTEETTDDNKVLFKFPTELRLRTSELIEVGMTQKELLLRIGAPDFVGDRWEYDFVSDESELTVRVHWEKLKKGEMSFAEYKKELKETVPRIEKIELIEPQWRQITMRDYEIIH